MPHDLPSPGTYLRLRREAAGLTIDDVAAIFGTVPGVPLSARADMLRSIEADVTPIGDDVIRVLMKARELGSFPFDPVVLVQLVDLQAGSPLQFGRPRICRVCACSQSDPCYRVGLGGYTCTCGWAEADLCDSCAPARPPHAAGPDDGDSGEETPPPANVPVNDTIASAGA
jgi:hypothetical protein